MSRPAAASRVLSDPRIAPQSPGEVTLAIDDGPSDVTPQLLNHLESGGHRAVLFVIGANTEGREHVLDDAIRRGFALGNHSFNHPRFSEIGVEEARAEIAQTEAVIEAAYARVAIKRPGKWFRFPYLDPGVEHFAAFQKVLREFGFERPTEIGLRLADHDLSRLDWLTTVNTRDWACPPEDELRQAMRQAKPGDVVEFHDKIETVGPYAAVLVEELDALSLRAALPCGPPLATSSSAPTPARIVVEGGQIGRDSGLADLWAHRDLLVMLSVRDIKLRYQQTAVGAAWALLQPLLIMLVLTAFASIVGVKSGSVPYPLYVMGGLVPWTYFTHAFTSTTNSLVSHGDIIGKIYFPRLVIPVAAALAGAIDFFVAGLLLPVFMVAYGMPATVALLAIPAFVVMALSAAFALGLWLAVLNVRYRDVVNALPFFIQLLFFATPIAYRSDMIPEPWRTLAGINPMVGVVDGFRWALLGDRAGGLHASTLVSLVSILVLLVSGVWYFRRREPMLADEI